MKKTFLFLMALVCAMVVNAQDKGTFTVQQFKGFKLHIYNHDGGPGDHSFVIEGPTSLIALETPLTKPYGAKYEEYMKKLNKPVIATITGYDVGGSFSQNNFIPEPLKETMKGMGNMVQNYKNRYGDNMYDIDFWTTTAEAVPNGATKTWDGITFRFDKGPSGFLTSATIVVGGQVALLHSEPSAGHLTTREAQNAAALDAAITNDELVLKSGVKTFITHHGSGLCTAKDVKNHLKYLKKVKALRAKATTPEQLAAAIQKAFPKRSGAENLAEVAANLFK
jgi:hypothetical protein